MTALESQAGARSTPTLTVSRRRILTILGSLTTGLVLAALDLTIVAAAVLVLGLALSLTLREPAVRQVSGIQRRTDADADTAATAARSAAAAATAAPTQGARLPVRRPRAAGERAVGVRGVRTHGTGVRAEDTVVPRQRQRA